MNQQIEEQLPEETSPEETSPEETSPEETPQEPTPADRLGLWELLRHESVADAPDDTAAADRVLARPRRSIWDL